jgi:hypothetical protein
MTHNYVWKQNKNVQKCSCKLWHQYACWILWVLIQYLFLEEGQLCIQSLPSLWPTEVVTTVPLRKFLLFCLFVNLQYFSCNIFNKYLINLYIFYWRKSVLIILQQKDYLYKSSYQPAGGCIFKLISDFRLTTTSTYEQAFRKYAVWNSESGCLMKNKGPITGPWKLRVLLYPSLKKILPLHDFITFLSFLSVRKDINTRKPAYCASTQPVNPCTNTQIQYILIHCCVFISSAW